MVAQALDVNYICVDLRKQYTFRKYNITVYFSESKI